MKNRSVAPLADLVLNRAGACASYFVVALAAVLLAVLPLRADADTTQLAREIERGMELWHVPGAAVAVVTSNEVKLRSGFGSISTAGVTPVDEHTLFAIASTTKAMVVTGLLILVDDGELSLDDPVIRYIPELHFPAPLVTSDISVRDLLTHRTGLPSTDFWTFFQGMPLREQIERLRHVNPEAPIRSRLIYQNTMFELAGLLIERVTRQRWDVFLTERLWEPIGMFETYGSRGQMNPQKNHVLPYFYANDELRQSEWDLPADQADAAGSVWSSIHDMSLWAQFLLRGGVTASNDRLISEAQLAEFFEPQQLSSEADFYPTVQLTRPNWRSYGLGWFQQDFQGRKIDFHTGSLAGLIAIIGLDRENDLGIVVLGNRDHAEMRHALMWEVMDNSPPGQRRDWNQEVFDLYARRDAEDERKWQETLGSRPKNAKLVLPIEAYVGRYESEANGEIEILRSGRRLTLHTGLIDLPMEHWQGNSFLVEYIPWGLREFTSFEAAPDGSIDAFVLFGYHFLRVKPAEENP